MTQTKTEMTLYETDPVQARQTMDLAHGMPEGFRTFEELDTECERLLSLGKVSVVNTVSINNSMEKIKDPNIDVKDFRDMAHILISQLAQEVTRRPLQNRKIAISVRAGLAFLGHAMKFMPEAEVGFDTQTRDEETAECTSFHGKLGSFTGKHAIVFDPMLATGGSMLDLVNEVSRRGAIGVTTVSMFTTPQGLVAVSRHPNVQEMITTPLEAGLNERKYIVGSHQPHSMLGDFGDRYFGSVD